MVNNITYVKCFTEFVYDDSVGDYRDKRYPVEATTSKIRGERWLRIAKLRQDLKNRRTICFDNWMEGERYTVYKVPSRDG